MTDDGQRELFSAAPYRVKPLPKPRGYPAVRETARFEFKPPKRFRKRKPCAVCYQRQVESFGTLPLSRQAVTFVIVADKRIAVCRPCAVEIRNAQRQSPDPA